MTANPSDSAALDVLVVDDEETVLSVVKQLALALGHSVRVAESGAEALEQLADTACDVVISDIRMPGMDGLQLAGEVRKLYPDINIILMTGYPSDQATSMASTLRISTCLHKPFKTRELDSALEATSRTSS